MSCRCEDIRCAEREREVLEDIFDRICDSEIYYNELKNSCIEIISTMVLSIYLQNNEFEMMKTRVENRIIKQEYEIRNYKNYINDKISSLEAKISRMRREDEWFHAHDD
ncbi:MAG: hypothetical protein E6496_12550, partial [Lachnoanaerobaculum sp.]|nr:hypothetical protein [Lachnoanaerobaculum sp.]